MTSCRIRVVAVLIVLLAAASTEVLAAGGTSIVASRGNPARVSAGWPRGVAELVNDPLRTTGWNSWFTEWPNDVNQYAFEVKNTGELNKLIEKLAAVKSDLRQVHLCHLKEPAGLGWVTSLPKGNNTPVIFSIGDQEQIDQWFKTVRKPFGTMEFAGTPVAVPPTLTIFVQNEAVNLEELKIPAGISVKQGYVPTVFHRFNTTAEKKREDAELQNKNSGKRAESKADLDPASQAAIKKIDAFLEKRKDKADR